MLVAPEESRITSHSAPPQRCLSRGRKRCLCGKVLVARVSVMVRLCLEVEVAGKDGGIVVELPACEVWHKLIDLLDATASFSLCACRCVVSTEIRAGIPGLRGDT